MIVFIFALIIITLEAYFEAKKGDKRHWPSLFLSVITFIGFTYLIKRNIITNLVGCYIPARILFDWIYNYFARNPWHYLGSNFTDRILKRFNKTFLFFARVGTAAALFLIFGIPDVSDTTLSPNLYQVLYGVSFLLVYVTGVLWILNDRK